MYLDYFGLTAEPFGLSPSLRFLYPSHAHEEAMAHLAYGLERGEEIILITGRIGIGKTLAVQSLTDRVARAFRCVVITTTTVSFRELLKLILHELDLGGDPQADTADLIGALKSHLMSPGMRDHRLLLVVDEGQNLSPDVLESLRLLLNVVPGSSRNPVIVLVGQPGLEATINRPDLLQLRQRIRVHYRMEPLSREETDAFIKHRLACCGREQPLFGDDAVALIHEKSGGVPRLVNHLADKALLTAFVDGKRKISRVQVDVSDMPPMDVVADLQVPRGEPASAKAAVPARPKEAGHGRSAMSGASRVRSRALLTGVLLVAVLVAAVYFLWPSLQARLANRTGRVAVADRVQGDVPVGGMSAMPREQAASAALPVAVDTSRFAATVAIGDSTEVDSEAAVAALAAEGTGDAHTVPSPTVGEEFAIEEADEYEYGLHVASFRTRDKAETLVAELIRDGHPAEPREHVVNGVRWQRVIVGPIRGKNRAVALEEQMRAAGLITYSRVLPW